MRGSSRARTFVVGKRTVAQSAALFQGFVSVRIGCLRITLRSIIVSINGYNFRLKDKHEAELLATSAKEGQALNRAGAQEKSIDFCQEVPASHRFGQAVIASCLKHTLSVFGRRIRSYRNSGNPSSSSPNATSNRIRLTSRWTSSTLRISAPEAAITTLYRGRKIARMYA
jgi:hypothetical protein